MDPLASLLILVLLVTASFWPQYGIFPRWRRARELTHRSRREDALKHILKSEANGRVATIESIAGAMQITTGTAAELLEDLEVCELLTFENGRLNLTQAGREMGLHVVRAHRLWESYLAEQTGLSEQEWHHRAEKQEHLLTPQQTAALEARLGHPLRDPHGDSIPGKDDDLQGDLSRSLNSAPVDTPVLITHLEDEPETIYKQLIALGLRPGMRALVTERSAARVRFLAEGSEHILAPVLAENVSIEPIPEVPAMELYEDEALCNLRPGGFTRVTGLSPACRGAERRRLLDLGFVPGTVVEVDMISPAGDPTAYRVRGSVVALRREQARLIRVNSKEVVAA